MAATVCGAVAAITDGQGNKTGEEVRFYDAATGTTLLKTEHIRDASKFGTYVVGTNYTITTATDTVDTVTGGGTIRLPGHRREPDGGPS